MLEYSFYCVWGFGWGPIHRSKSCSSQITCILETLFQSLKRQGKIVVAILHKVLHYVRAWVPHTLQAVHSCSPGVFSLPWLSTKTTQHILVGCHFYVNTILGIVGCLFFLWWTLRLCCGTSMAPALPASKIISLGIVKSGFNPTPKCPEACSWFIQISHHI